ncbi:DUF58 domain-containing protein [Planosporangium thailandense]|uniref:DUF58 domain-containing protein n=1 Tax=Planosporangium thailandense TaxID=765197 RepID=A0ABX0Y056_9ACTN|nr:DUF58 domain-containing protein [Planosporangium thailandense]
MTERVPLLLVAGALVVPWTPAPWLGAAVVVGALLVLVLADLAVAAPLTTVALARDGDRVMWLDETATVRLTLTNGSPRRLRARVRDAWVPSAGAGPYSHRLDLEPGASGTVETTLRPTRRGDRPCVRVSLRSYGPLGLAYRQSRQRTDDRRTPPWTIRVLPRFTSRRYLPEKLARLRVLDGAVVTRGRGQGTEFDALREYVVGDDVRSIDWRASARRSDVVVRSWRPERDRRVLCVLDTGRTSAVRVGDEPRLDAAIDAALLLSSLAARAGDRVDLLAVDTAVRASVAGVGQQALMWRLVSALAPLEPALVETDFGLVAGEVLRRERKRSLVVLFTALEPAALGEGLLPVLARLAARHKVVVAAVHDQQLARLTDTAGSGSVDDLYTAAAAHRALAERDRVRAALTRHGVEVVDAPVELFASRVADAYLAMKATGRL